MARGHISGLIIYLFKSSVPLHTIVQSTLNVLLQNNFIFKIDFAENFVGKNDLMDLWLTGFQQDNK